MAMIAHFASFLALITYASAAMIPRQCQSSDFCRPSVVNGIQNILLNSDPTKAWQAAISPGQTAFDAISVVPLNATNPAQQWAVSPVNNGNALIFANQVSPTTACAAATGGPINSEDCANPPDTNQVLQFFVTCNTCDDTGLTGCMIQSAFEGQFATNAFGGTIATEDPGFEGFEQSFNIVPVPSS